jgi:hypothetical protein
VSKTQYRVRLEDPFGWVAEYKPRWWPWYMYIGFAWHEDEAKAICDAHARGPVYYTPNKTGGAR